MARVVFDDAIYRDQRFVDLYLKLDCVSTAIGALVNAQFLSERWPDRKIPMSEWKNRRMNNAVIEVGLAEIRDGKVCLCECDIFLEEDSISA